MRTKIAVILLIIVAIGLPIIIIRVQSTLATVRAAQEAASTEFTPVQTGTVRDFIETVGEVEANTIADLGFIVSGTVSELYVAVNDYVAEGSVLAVLDNQAEVISYQQGFLALNRAQADEYDLQTIDEDEIAIAQASVNAAWASYGSTANQYTTEDRIAAETEYQEAIADAQRLSQEASTAPGGFNSPAYDLLSAEAGEAALRAEITRLQNEQAIAQNQSSANATYGQVLQAEAELDRVLAGASPAQLEEVALNIQMMEQQLTNLQSDYEDTFLIAPFAGYVSSLDVEVGATVTQNVPVMQLMDITPLVLTTTIDETDLGNVSAGMPVEVRFDALPDLILQATLGDISTQGTTVDGIVTFDAPILVEAFPMGVRIGMTADVRIITEERTNVISIPNSFLLEDTDTGQVTVNILGDDGELVERTVTLGLRGVETSEVVDGLAAGDIVALRNEVTLTPRGGRGGGGGGGPFGGGGGA